MPSMIVPTLINQNWRKIKFSINLQRTKNIASLGKNMTCYFRHLGVVFAKAGIEVRKENRKQLSSTIKIIAGGNMDCPAVWRQVKKRLAEDEDGFVSELKTAWENHAPIIGAKFIQ